MNKIICIVIATLFMHSVYADDSPSYVENELIIWLEHGVAAKEFAINSSQKILPKSVLSESLNIWLFEFTDEIEQRSIREREARMRHLASNINVKYVQNNHTNITLRRLPNDTHYGLQWAPAIIQLPIAWDIATGGFTTVGDRIVVAVIDDGFDLTHNDLSFRNGWNAINQTGNIPSARHGTHVSGIIGAIGNNGRGISGVNWNVAILPVIAYNNNNTISEAVVVRAYSYVRDRRVLYNQTNGQSGDFIVATNSSFGIDRANSNNYPIWCAMYNELGQVGILNVAATANGNWNVDQVGDMPTTCSSPYLISVTNTNSADVKSTSPAAAFGINNIDIGAPGTSIYSTVPNNYDYISGTSMAAPQVAGVIALMYAAMSQSMIQAYKSNPANIALLVKQHLLDGADRIPSLNGLVASSRRLNASEAVKKVADCPSITLMSTQPPPPQMTRRVECREIIIQNATVPSGRRLELKATDRVVINPGFTVESGATFIVE